MKNVRAKFRNNVSFPNQSRRTVSRIPSLKNSLFLAEVQICYKTIIPITEMEKVGSSTDAAEYLFKIWKEFDNIEHIESFVILYLNKGNRLCGWSLISIGGVAATVADPKIIFQCALLANASGIILSHNHPSGNRRPSDTDLHLTRKLKAAGELLDIIVWDHIIITPQGEYYSFGDEGTLIY